MTQNNRPKPPFSIVRIILFVALGLVFMNLIGLWNKETPQLTLTEIVKKIKMREIEKIVVEGETITIYDKDGKVFGSSKPFGTQKRGVVP